MMSQGVYHTGGVDGGLTLWIWKVKEPKHEDIQCFYGENTGNSMISVTAIK